MSLTAILAGLKAAYSTVTDLKCVLSYAPNSIQTVPMLFSTLKSIAYDDTQTAQDEGLGYVPHYRIQSRLVVAWQENEQAEIELADLAEQIAEAVGNDPTLGGALGDGHARIMAADTGWIKYPVDAPQGQGIEYRICDFTVDVWEV